MSSTDAPDAYRRRFDALCVPHFGCSRSRGVSSRDPSSARGFQLSGSSALETAAATDAVRLLDRRDCGTVAAERACGAYAAPSGASSPPRSLSAAPATRRRSSCTSLAARRSTLAGRRHGRTCRHMSSTRRSSRSAPPERLRSTSRTCTLASPDALAQSRCLKGEQ